MKIFIRYGHEILSNGYNTSANNRPKAGTIKEYEGIKQYGEILENIFKEEGYDVKTFKATEKKYTTVNGALKAGINSANRWDADIFISLHLNAFDGTAEGTEVLYYPSSTGGLYYAEAISKEISTALGTVNRGAKQRNLLELRTTNMIAVIVEPIFCDNINDCIKFSPQRTAEAIFYAVTGVRYRKYNFPLRVEVTRDTNARASYTTKSYSAGKYPVGKQLKALQYKNNGTFGWFLCEDEDNKFRHWVSAKYLKILE